jgi:hypothetical protein
LFVRRLGGEKKDAQRAVLLSDRGNLMRTATVLIALCLLVACQGQYLKEEGKDEEAKGEEVKEEKTEDKYEVKKLLLASIASRVSTRSRRIFRSLACQAMPTAK